MKWEDFTLSALLVNEHPRSIREERKVVVDKFEMN